MNDDGMLNVIQGIVGQVMGAMGVQTPAPTNQNGTSPQPLTISQFLESMPGYSYNEGRDDILTDLLMSLARIVTFRDLIGLVGGGVGESQEVMARLREPLQNFMRRRMINIENQSQGKNKLLQV